MKPFFRKGRDGGRDAAAKKSLSFDATNLAALEEEIDEWVHTPRSKTGDIMVERGYLEPDELEAALARQEEVGGHLGDVLLGMGYIDEHQLAEVLAFQFEIPLADLRSQKPEREAVDIVGEELARKHGVIPLHVEDGRVYVVTGDPLATEAIRELTEQCERIGILVGAKSDIARMIDQAYSALRSAEIHIQAFELADYEDEQADEGNTLAVDENAPIVQVVNRVIMQGVRARASDIHIEPQAGGIRVRYRIDGALSDAIVLPLRMAPAMSSRIKVMAELNIVERRRPQDGQFSVTVDNRPIDVRTSVVATVHGEKIVLRLLDKSRSLIGLDELGMPAEVRGPYIKIVKAPLGMLLCTGPTGSGKTTTLYATLTEVNDDTRNVVTIEDPVEYQFDGVNQMQISEASGITFADGLRGILRQDPDVILVGEIRDVETARIATQAALTGHFVLSSLHAVDSVAALHRFTDMGIPPFLVASAINGVIGQRLLRRICNSCRNTYTPTPDHVALVRASVGRVPEKWTHGIGCNLCSGTGYNGRVGVYELLQVSDEIRELIVAKATHNEIRASAIAGGMRTMQNEAFGLVADGMTTVDDVLRSVYAPTIDLTADEADEIDEDIPISSATLRAVDVDVSDAATATDTTSASSMEVSA